MKNLILSNASFLPLFYVNVNAQLPQAPSFGNENASSLGCVTLDPDSGSVFVGLQNDLFKNGLWVSKLPKGTLVHLQYLPENESLCAVMSTGELYIFSQNEFEAVGIVDSGVLAVSWSPDLELVVLVTGQGTLLEMTRDFDLVSETPIQVDEHGIALQVALGWGKKETQFHGSEGKAAATLKKSESDCLSPDDDSIPRLSWRGDGLYYCCSSIDEKTNKRTLRVYNREGVLQNTSETVPGLESSLCWKPSGNLIASTQLLPHRRDVVFFERNGLRHGEFSIPRNMIVQELLWNCDSTILALLFKQERNGQMISGIHLRTCQNYHWSLKQELLTESTFSSLLWDTEDAFKLHALSIDGLYHCYQFHTEIYQSTSLAPSNPSVVANVDGDLVKVTPFLKRMVPPPMSFAEFKCSAAVQHVAFGPEPSGTTMAVLLSNNCVELWAHVDQFSKAILKIGSIQIQGHPRQIVWNKPGEILALGSEGNVDVLVQYSFDPNQPGAVESKHISIPKKPFGKIVRSESFDKVALESLDGQIFEMGYDEDEIYFSPSIQFPSYCQTIAYIQTPPSERGEWIGLSDRNKLYLGSQLLNSECTSFAIHSQFLIITTLSQTTRFASLNVDIDELKFKDTSAQEDKGPAYDESVGAIERGATIVTTTPSSIHLIYQLPRGNLEIVAPRALVLANIRQLIDDLKYRDAFILSRKHRIDMNFLVDYKYAQFKEKVSDFVDQIQETDYFNLLITSLKNEDTTVTVYSGFAKPTGPKRDVSNKVNSICDLLHHAFIGADPIKYMHSILTCDAKRDPPALEDAMRRIRDLRENVSSSVAESALVYLIFLADVNKLYDVALGMYDFQLVLMVAQHSQKDPREYLTFLSDLQKLELNYQRFKIDDYLGRHESALSQLSFAGESKFAEFISYMKRHELYTTALELYPIHSDKCNKIMVLFAEYLAAFGGPGEAGLLFESAGEFEKAAESYAEGGLWKETLGLCHLLNSSDSVKASLGNTLIQALIESRRFEDAAQVSIEFHKDPSVSVEYLLTGHLWSDALLTIRQNGLPQMIESHLKPALHSRALAVEQDLAHRIETVIKQHERLKQVREEKRQLIDSFGMETDELDDIDMFSDTASMATSRMTGSSLASSRMTAMTGKSGRTSKNRRKMARRRAAGKDAAFEDEFLMDSIAKTMVWSNSSRNELKALTEACLLHGVWNQAREIQRLFRTLLETVQARQKDIFEDPTKAIVDPDDEVVSKPVLNYKPAPKLSDDTWYTSAFSH